LDGGSIIVDAGRVTVDAGTVIVIVEASSEMVEIKEMTTVLTEAERHDGLLELVVVETLELVGWPTKQEHALDNLDEEDKHGEAKVRIARAGATVYLWQKEDALLGFPDNALKQFSVLQAAVAMRQ